MFGKKDSHEREEQDAQQLAELNREIESIICRLQQLKDRVTQLRTKCEEFKGTALENKLEQTGNIRCNRCGHVLDPIQGVVVKDSDGRARACYHMKCFQTVISRVSA